jgi:1-acyl-sn-glycerol-3-phosphate acyltransferase
VSVLPRRVYFLAAEKFYKSKFWYPIVAWTGQIKVERESSDKKDWNNLENMIILVKFKCL